MNPFNISPYLQDGENKKNGSLGNLIKSHQTNRVCRIILGFLHIVSVCMKGFDCHSSAKRSPFSPTPLCHNMHKP